MCLKKHWLKQSGCRAIDAHSFVFSGISMDVKQINRMRVLIRKQM